MSNSHAEDTVHTGPIKNPKQLLWTVAAAFIIPIFLIIGLVLFVTTGFKPSGTNQVATMGLGGITEEARDRAHTARLQKVGMVEIRDANRPLKGGEEVFKAQCSACHAAGVAGAPKFGDKEAWAPRIVKGYDTLLNSALRGKGAMGPQGGGDFDDVEIGRAVVYMTNAAGGDLPEPTKDAASQQAAGGGAAPAAAGGAPAAGGASAAPAAAVATAAAAVVAQAKDRVAAETAATQPAAASGTAAASPATTLAATTPPAAGTPATPPPSAAPAAAERVAAVSPAPAPAAASGAGEALYKSACFACHGAGVAGAPKFGDKDAWAPRIAQGVDHLVTSVIQGKGIMPPRGGSTASDADIRAAVDYMVSAAK